MSEHKPVGVIHESEGASATRGQRLLRAVTIACVALGLAGIGIGNLLMGANAASIARRHVLAEGDKVAPGLDHGWLDASPVPVARRKVPERMQQARDKNPQLMFLCHLNEALLRLLWQKGTGLVHAAGPGAPREFDVFTGENGSVFPRYRYPPSTTMNDGLTTNAFGFRGPEIALDKPTHTVRVAFAGASSIADVHHFAWGFPELIVHWLNLWAEQKALPVRFEGINAGREAIVSTDIHAIVVQEVLPLAVDYVVYYEGQNQFGVTDMLRHVRVEGPFTPGTPPAHVLADLATIDAAQPTWLDTVCLGSETARRVRRLLGIYDGMPEPHKPAQELALPAGMREDAADLARAGELLQIGQILRDLDAIRTACTAAGARLVMCSFDRIAHRGLLADLKTGHSLYSHLNRDYWPLSYDIVHRLDAQQNLYYAAWARERGVPWIDVAAMMPDEPVLFTDMVHSTELGSRLRAWVMFAGLLPIVEADLARGAVPVPDTQRDTQHPFLRPARRITAEELDK